MAVKNYLTALFMSKTSNEIQAAKCFSCRNIKKEFNVFADTESVTKQYHLELTENNEVVVVEDRPTDWVELANKDVDQVGLANVLGIIERQGLDVRTACVFRDEEAIDTSMLDPMNPHVYQQATEAKDESYKKLQATAASLGVSVDTLLTAAMTGTLENLIKANQEKTKSEAGGEQ